MRGRLAREGNQQPPVLTGSLLYPGNEEFSEGVVNV